MKNNRGLFIFLAIVLLVSNVGFIDNKVYAKTKKLNLSTNSLSITVSETSTVKVKGNYKIKVKASKKKYVKVSVGGKKIKVKGLKKGNVKLSVYGYKKGKLKAKGSIKIKIKKQTKNNNTDKKTDKSEDSNNPDKKTTENKTTEEKTTEEDTLPEDNKPSQIYINGEPAKDMEITLYSLPAREGIAMPESYPTTIKLDVTGYTQSLYFYSDIDRYINGYWTPGNNYIQLEEGNYLPTGKSYDDYDETITIIADSQRFYLKIHYISYERIYFDEKITDIIESIIHKESSEYEKIEAVTKYVAENYYYDGRYSNSRDMLFYGGGDCWATSQLIMDLLAKVNIKCRWHHVYPQESHVNVVAVADEKIYELEASYVETPPRKYDIWEISEGCKCYSVFSDDGMTTVAYCLGDYEGFQGEEVVLPEMINGLPLTAISGLAFYNYVHFTNEKIKSIYIPKTIDTIYDSAFYGITDLKSIIVDRDSEYFVVENNMLFSKDKTVLYYVAEGQYKDIVIPDSVEEIKGYFSAWDYNVTSVKLGSGVKRIGKNAFWATCISDIELPEGLEIIEKDAFAETQITNVTVPKSVTKIESWAFACEQQITITILNPETELEDCFVNNNAIIKGYKNSTAEKYALDNNITFEEIK
ncbi:Leucine rich repeat-containing protein [Lachnospiraceae bacterium]|nr:Leucine rich repeat-containing protein [Lachnospiraceae bacterium]